MKNIKKMYFAPLTVLAMLVASHVHGATINETDGWVLKTVKKLPPKRNDFLAGANAKLQTPAQMGTATVPVVQAAKKIAVQIKKRVAFDGETNITRNQSGQWVAQSAPLKRSSNANAQISNAQMIKHTAPVRAQTTPQATTYKQMANNNDNFQYVPITDKTTLKNYQQIQEKVLPATRGQTYAPPSYHTHEYNPYGSSAATAPSNTGYAQTAQTLPSKSSYLLMPVNYNRVSSGYGLRVHPVDKKVKMHTGVDFAAPKNSPIHAAQGGVVTFAGWRGGYGLAVIIQHNSNFSTLYGHANSLSVVKNQVVQAGQMIGRVGSTGKSTGNHLHFEVLYNNQHTNPREFLVF